MDRFIITLKDDVPTKHRRDCPEIEKQTMTNLDPAHDAQQKCKVCFK